MPDMCRVLDTPLALYTMSQYLALYLQKLAGYVAPQHCGEESSQLSSPGTSSIALSDSTTDDVSLLLSLNKDDSDFRPAAFSPLLH